jgi:long-chain acyl-CoA synthetase
MTAASVNERVSQTRFQTFAERNGDVLAVVDPDGSVWTRRRLGEDTNRLAHALREGGCGPSTVLALVAPNCAEFLISYLAATQIGMYVVPVNWHLTPAEIQYIIEDCGADVLVAHSRFLPAMDVVMQRMTSPPRLRISMGGAIPHFTGFEDFVSGFSSAAIASPAQGRVLSYTSATTGRPKGVSLPIDDADRVLNLSTTARVSAGTLPEEHVQLCASMLYHGAPLEGVVVSLHMGHSVILMDRLEPEGILAAIDRHRVTMAYIVPSMFARLLTLNKEIRTRYSTASLRKVLHAGAACPIDVKHRMIEWWGPIFWEAYGATEGAGTVVNSQDWLRFPGTVGKPMNGTRLKILAEDGSELPADSIGTVYLTRYSGDRFEYLNAPEKTRASYRGDFFTVGDLGYVNEEGFLFLRDRVIDVINLSGSKVYPAELESVLHKHPHVADCAVIGVPDARFGEAILAVICPTTSATGVNELKRDLVRWLSQHVSIAKMPRRFEFIAEIPRDIFGKVQKKKLREHYALSQYVTTACLR